MKITSVKKKYLNKWNIDDYIRARKRESYSKGKQLKRLFWDKKQWSVLNTFYDASCNGIFSPHKIRLKNGEQFMGIKHFKSK